MKLIHKKIILYALFVSGIMVICFPLLFTDTIGTVFYIFATIGCVIEAAAVIWMNVALKCPYCGHRLPFRNGDLLKSHCFCPNCGEEVE